MTKRVMCAFALATFLTVTMVMVNLLTNVVVLDPVSPKMLAFASSQMFMTCLATCWITGFFNKRG